MSHNSVREVRQRNMAMGPARRETKNGCADETSISYPEREGGGNYGHYLTPSKFPFRYGVLISLYLGRSLTTLWQLKRTFNVRLYEEYCTGLRIIGKTEERNGLGAIQGTFLVFGLKDKGKELKPQVR
jgi:hypothetical protein